MWTAWRRRTGWPPGGSFLPRWSAGVLWCCRLAGGRPAFADKIRIIIEPKAPSAPGITPPRPFALEVLSSLLDAGRLRAGQTFLDLGTGSGVLGIACCKSGLRGLGLDIDPLAVENAEENRARNAVPGLDLGLGGVEAAEGHTYDLILANHSWPGP